MPRTPTGAPEPGPATIQKADFIEGMAKGMAVLESFDTERQRLNATQAAERAGLTRAAARRHLLTLAHLGYLESDGHAFWLSAKVLRFSGSYLASARLPRMVQATLNRLAAQTLSSYSVVVRDEAEVVIVARSATYSGAERILAYGLHLGARLPAHATSTGRVLLAALDSRALLAWLRVRDADGRSAPRELARLTPLTVTDHKAFKARIAQVRTDDYCLASEEHELGVHALAVPLRNMQGQTLAALNLVASPRTHTPEQLLREQLPVMQDAARELRALL